MNYNYLLFSSICKYMSFIYLTQELLSPTCKILKSALYLIIVYHKYGLFLKQGIWHFQRSRKNNIYSSTGREQVLFQSVRVKKPHNLWFIGHLVEFPEVLCLWIGEIVVPDLLLLCTPTTKFEEKIQKNFNRV